MTLAPMGIPLVGPCQGVPRAITPQQQAWRKKRFIAGRERSDDLEGVEADKWTCRQTDRQEQSQESGEMGQGTDRADVGTNSGGGNQVNRSKEVG